MTTATEAYAAIAQRLLDTVNGGGATICGYVPEIRWPLRNYIEAPDATKLYVRFSVNPQGEVRRTLSMPSRITKQGLLNAQIFAPLNIADAAAKTKQLAYLIEAAYANGEFSGVTYINAYSKETPRTENWYCERVTATYRYDDWQ